MRASYPWTRCYSFCLNLARRLLLVTSRVWQPLYAGSTYIPKSTTMAWNMDPATLLLASALGGKGGGKGGGGGGGERADNGQLICRAFRTAAGCSFADACRFAHCKEGSTKPAKRKMTKKEKKEAKKEKNRRRNRGKKSGSDDSDSNSDPDSDSDEGSSGEDVLVGIEKQKKGKKDKGRPKMNGKVLDFGCLKGTKKAVRIVAYERNATVKIRVMRDDDKRGKPLLFRIGALPAGVETEAQKLPLLLSPKAKVGGRVVGVEKARENLNKLIEMAEKSGAVAPYDFVPGLDGPEAKNKDGSVDDLCTRMGSIFQEKFDTQKAEMEAVMAARLGKLGTPARSPNDRPCKQPRGTFGFSGPRVAGAAADLFGNGSFEDGSSGGEKEMQKEKERLQKAFDDELARMKQSSADAHFKMEQDLKFERFKMEKEMWERQKQMDANGYGPAGGAGVGPGAAFGGGGKGGGSFYQFAEDNIRDTFGLGKGGAGKGGMFSGSGSSGSADIGGVSWGTSQGEQERLWAEHNAKLKAEEEARQRAANLEAAKEKAEHDAKMEQERVQREFEQQRQHEEAQRMENERWQVRKTAMDELFKMEVAAYEAVKRKSTMGDVNEANYLEGVNPEYLGSFYGITQLGEAHMVHLDKRNYDHWVMRQSDAGAELAGKLLPTLTELWRHYKKPAERACAIMGTFNAKWNANMDRTYVHVTIALLKAGYHLEAQAKAAEANGERMHDNGR